MQFELELFFQELMAGIFVHFWVRDPAPQSHTNLWKVKLELNSNIRTNRSVLTNTVSCSAWQLSTQFLQIVVSFQVFREFYRFWPVHGRCQKLWKNACIGTSDTLEVILKWVWLEWGILVQTVTVWNQLAVKEFVMYLVWSSIPDMVSGELSCSLETDVKSAPSVWTLQIQ